MCATTLFTVIFADQSVEWNLNEGFNDWSIAFTVSHVENVLNDLCRKVIAESDDFGDDISFNLRVLLEQFSLLFANRRQ